MQAPVHLAIGWFAAEALGVERPRDRRIIGLAGLSPDFDAVVYPLAYLYFGFDRNRAFTEVWTVVHHHYTHGVGFAILVGVAGFALSGSGGLAHASRIGALAAIAVLIHVFCDLIAAGATFPVYPWWPFSDASWTASWSWELREWPNQLITVGAIAATLVYAKVGGRSPLESLSYRLDAWVVRIVQRGSDADEDESAQTNSWLGRHRRLVVRIMIYAALAVGSAAVIAPVASDLF